ncbi:hypothetical protein BAUCODRAFT_66326 [Baudoinia panamericana UAMH 10762]|uniref:FAD/NAD(P)-binding domain-containing protein n=1 Tax=Baudoinia panamericana (strain UAMH 10762) TaxID=717646 RepID=M2NG70_BAUPA|nr:uncharacterized protein BAUCODRAFT_66326 [Baudoinia panamericana UAMH 10762]EMC98299.1 hypothetical protein BAUCODRAFT_66326 [Baudoinia panamericana UAMH 10762]
MSQPQRTPLARFEDIPGKLPESSVPGSVDFQTLADQAVEKLNNLTPDNVTESVVWRDLLSFTGTYRTFNSRANVVNTLRDLRQSRRCSAFYALGSGVRTERSLSDISWCDVDVLFDVQIDGLAGKGRGIVSLACCADGQWRIWMLRTWLECFEGHGHPDVPVSDGIIRVDSGNSASRSPNTDYDVVIVGSGQSGLSTAGRLKALGIRYVVLEKRPEVGHVWASRYESLRWHTSKHYGSLPFGHSYPDEDDYMLPAKRIGAGHKAWSEKYDINVRTSTAVDAASYDAESQTWTVRASTPEAQQTFTTRNLVLAIGTGHLTPVVPEWASPEKIASSGFKGTILHGSNYKNCTLFAGKRGVVVGTANTAHDVAEDMANVGMSTTLVQRGATFIFPAEWLHHAEDVHYNPNVDPAEADRISFTHPNKIMRELVNRAVFAGIKANPDRFDALEKAGFKLDRYGDIYNNLYVRFGGHYVDIGASERIAKGEIKVTSRPVKKMYKDGLVFEDGGELPADLIVLCTGFDHDFRKDAARIVGADVADQMDDFWGVDAEGEVRGHAKIAGHPHLYYHGGDIRMARFYSRFLALQLQADALGRPLQPYVG